VILLPQFSSLSSSRFAGYRLQAIIFNLQPSTFNLQPSTFNLQPSTFNLQPSTFNPQPSTLNLQPSTLNPQTSLLAMPLRLEQQTALAVFCGTLDGACFPWLKGSEFDCVQHLRQGQQTQALTNAD
jgi:hypothetical protein